ncbi:MAG: carbohydrate kinase family protein [Pseudomonadales bacterium]|jgi:adenosine kinase|nr:carbohydrate kinase family protein [Pseudomonadales bacterium]MDG1441934.1 carbohydrate kinase family protein [Pseudomonadales bacterium]
MNSVIVCGSLAIDTLCSYDGSFADYEEQFPTTGLNISLQLKGMHTGFGGCGMNIAYGLLKLGINPLPITVAGRNYAEQYEAHLKQLGMDTRYIVVDQDYEHSATCIIYSDQDGNQITAFHSGAARSSKRLSADQIEEIAEVEIAILAPEDAPIMIRQAKDLNRHGLSVIFDPGQGLSAFSKEEIRTLLSLSQYVVVNSHEWEILRTNSELSAEEIIDTHLVIVTRGEDGVEVYQRSEPPIFVEAAPCEQIIDPTGCGDAFRAGYIFGMLRKQSVRGCAELGCLLAVRNLAQLDSQLYEITAAELLELQSKTYNDGS